MGEGYTGVKFKCELRGPLEGFSSQTDSCLSLDKKLKTYLSPKSNEGNMSMRTGGGFLIKAAGAEMTKLTKEDLSFVYSVNEDDFLVYAKGKTPSSETFLHHYIYKTHQDISIVLHFHDDALLKHAKHLPSIGPFPYGSHKLARESAKVKASVLSIVEHGFAVRARNEAELLGILTALRL